MKTNDSCMIIAEAGVNHNGRLELALRLCDAAREAGADVVKFQTWRTDRIITRTVAMAEYQEKNTGVKESQYDMLRRLELPYEDFAKIKRYCDEIGIVFASTADESESLDQLLRLGIPFIKIGSGEIGNIPFLRYAGTKGLPVILSTGMSTLADVDLSVRALREGGAEDITLLHCTTSYPCPFEDVNLRAMRTLRDAFHLPVGYSDHTMGTEVAVAAITMGACVIEKHLTLDRRMEGPDHQASMEPGEFAQMVRQLRNVERAMGSGVKQPTGGEEQIQGVVKKRIVAAAPIHKGNLLTERNICVKRSNDGEDARLWDRVEGHRARRDLTIDEGLSISDVEEG